MQNNAAIVPAKQRALEQIQRSNLLTQTYTLEKQRLEQIVELALMVENPANRWQEYERLKAMASDIVGFEAQRSELATCGHYEVMMDFIDWLLPDETMAAIEMESAS